MMRILRTRASRSDYEEIWSYVAVHDLAAADRLLDRFDATLRALALTPQIGRQVDDLAQGLRSFPVGNYLIFYRIAKDTIQLIRLVHGARDITPEYFSE